MSHRRADAWIVAAALALVLAASFAVRVHYVLRTPQPGVVFDAMGYDMSARRLVKTGSYAFPVLLGSLGEEPEKPGDRTYLNIGRNAWTVPGYSVFLAGVYKVSGMGEQRLVAARLVQCVLGTLTILLAYLIAAKLRSRWAGLLAAVLVAVYPPYIAATGFIYTEVLSTFLLAAFLLVLVHAVEKRTTAWWVWAALLFAVSAYVRPIVLLWYFAVAAYLLLSRVPKREAIRHLAVFGVIVVLAFVPWWVRNYGIYRRFVPLTTSSANPLFASTTESYERGGRPSHVYPADLAQRVADGEPELLLNDYWQRVGRRRLAEGFRERPAWALSFRWRQMVAMTTNLWPTSIPFIDGRPWLIAFQQRWHTLLWWLVPLGALAGLFDRRILLLATLVPYFLVMHALTLPQARYQYPMLLVAAIVGAAGIDVLLRLARRAIHGSRAPAKGAVGRSAA